VQGNSTRQLLLADWSVIEREVRRIVIEGRVAAGTSSTSATACCPIPTRNRRTRVVELIHGL